MHMDCDGDGVDESDRETVGETDAGVRLAVAVTVDDAVVAAADGVRVAVDELVAVALSVGIMTLPHVPLGHRVQ